MKENRYLEWKESVSSTFLKTVSAFANFGTGKILFGVRNDGAAVGITNPEAACLAIENRINDSIQPKPDFSFSINRRTNVITLEVREGEFKPYLLKGKAYRRTDTASVVVDQVETKKSRADSHGGFSRSTCERSRTSSLGYPFSYSHCHASGSNRIVFSRRTSDRNERK